MPAPWSFWYDALPPVVLCGIVVAILHVSHRQAIGSPWVYPWIYPWIFPWISTKKSVDMDVDIDGKFHIHGKPGATRWFAICYDDSVTLSTILDTFSRTDNSPTPIHPSLYVAEPEITLIISPQHSRDTRESLATIASHLSIIVVVDSFLDSFLTAAEMNLRQSSSLGAICLNTGCAMWGTPCIQGVLYM